jgi:hypothetical protein
MSNIATLLCALLLLAVNDKKSAPPVPATQGAGGWAIISQGAAVQMQGNGPWYFDFPSNGGVGYVYKLTEPLGGRADHNPALCHPGRWHT